MKSTTQRGILLIVLALSAAMPLIFPPVGVYGSCLISFGILGFALYRGYKKEQLLYTIVFILGGLAVLAGIYLFGAYWVTERRIFFSYGQVTFLLGAGLVLISRGLKHP